MVTLAHTFESGQPNGTTITAGNSGVGGNAFDAASAGAGGTLIYDGTALRGAQCLQATTGAGAVAASASWTTAIGTAIAREYGRMVAKPGSLATAAVYHRARGGAAVQAFRIVLNTSGIWELRNNASSLLVSASVAITTSDTWRIAWDITVGASVTGVLYIYHDPTSATPDETLTANSANFGTNNINEMNWGVCLAAANTSLRLDDLCGTDVALPGPAQQSITVSESATAGETVARTLSVARSLAEAFAIADNPARALALPRSAGELVTVVDAVDLILVPPIELHAGHMELSEVAAAATPSTRSALAATTGAAAAATTSTTSARAATATVAAASTPSTVGG